jgi:hypothetical protein
MAGSNAPGGSRITCSSRSYVTFKERLPTFNGRATQWLTKECDHFATVQGFTHVKKTLVSYCLQ